MTDQTEQLREAIPSSLELRALLEETVVQDLRGASLPDEEIDEPSVRDRYLVGVLAPRRQYQDDAWLVARNFPNYNSSLTIPNCAGEQP